MIRETRFIQEDGGPYVEGRHKYVPPRGGRFGARIVHHYRRPVYTAGQIHTRLVTHDDGLDRIPVHPRGLSGPNRFPAELWERRAEGMREAFDQIRTSAKYGFKTTADTNLPPLMPTSDITGKRPWPIRTWCASTFIDRAKQVVSEATRLNIAISEPEPKPEPGDDPDYTEPKKKKKGREQKQLGGLTAIFRQYVTLRSETRTFEGQRHRLAFEMGVLFATMVEVLVSYTTVFVDVKTIPVSKRLFREKEKKIDDNVWSEMPEFEAIIDSIASAVVGVGFDRNDRGATLASLVEHEMKRYSSVDDMEGWAQDLNTAHGMLKEERASLFQRWIYFAELTAFVQATGVKVDHQADIDAHAPAALLQSRFQADATPLDAVDYLEAQIMIVVLMFYKYLWAKPTLWSQANRTILSSDDFYQPGRVRYGNKQTRRREQVFRTVTNMSEILFDLSKSYDAAYSAQMLHNGRAELFGGDDTSFIGAMRNAKTVAEMEAAARDKNKYALAILNHEEIRFWTPFPETQPFTLQPQGWGRSLQDAHVPWTAWQAPVGNVLRHINRGKTYAEATPVPIMGFDSVQESFDESSNSALAILHAAVLEYILHEYMPVPENDDDDATFVSSPPSSPDKRAWVIFSPTRVLESSLQGLMGVNMREFPKKTSLRKLSAIMEKLKDRKYAWLKSLHDPDTDFHLETQTHLLRQLNLAYIALLNRALGRNGTGWVITDEQDRIYYEPLSHRKGPPIVKLDRIHVYTSIENWFSDFVSTTQMVVTALDRAAPLDQDDVTSTQAVRERLIEHMTHLTSLYTSNPAFSVTRKMSTLY